MNCGCLKRDIADIVFIYIHGEIVIKIIEIIFETK